MVRASVSKTEGPRFESEHSCHPFRSRRFVAPFSDGALPRPQRLQKTQLVMQFAQLRFFVLRCKTIRPFRHPLLKTFTAGLVPAFFFVGIRRTPQVPSSSRTINRNRGSGAAGQTGTGKTIVRGIRATQALSPATSPGHHRATFRPASAPLLPRTCFHHGRKLSAALPTARTDLPPLPFTGSG